MEAGRFGHLIGKLSLSKKLSFFSGKDKVLFLKRQRTFSVEMKYFFSKDT
tara:strand:+ start:715 stop:864 length:150 start_codon:yes stop_codon:yes gene_type:complete